MRITESKRTKDKRDMLQPFIIGKNGHRRPNPEFVKVYGKDKVKNWGKSPEYGEDQESDVREGWSRQNWDRLKKRNQLKSQNFAL